MLGTEAQMRLLILTAVVLFQFVANPSAQAQQPAALSVGTVPAERRPVTRASEFVGRVDIHARTVSVPEHMMFKET